jgi:hypothetical protein
VGVKRRKMRCHQMRRGLACNVHASSKGDRCSSRATRNPNTTSSSSRGSSSSSTGHLEEGVASRGATAPGRMVLQVAGVVAVEDTSTMVTSGSRSSMVAGVVVEALASRSTSEVVAVGVAVVVVVAHLVVAELVEVVEAVGLVGVGGVRVGLVGVVEVGVGVGAAGEAAGEAAEAGVEASSVVVALMPVTNLCSKSQLELRHRVVKRVSCDVGCASDRRSRASTGEELHCGGAANASASMYNMS